MDYTLPLYLLITLFIGDIIIGVGKWSKMDELEKKFDKLRDDLMSQYRPL